MADARTANLKLSATRVVRQGSGRSSTDPAHVVESTVVGVYSAVAFERAAVRILLPDASGRLRTYAAHGEAIPGGRLRSTRRREVFETGEHRLVKMRGAAGYALAIFPLVCDGRSIGVTEVVAPAERLHERWDAIEAIVAQSAITLRSVIDKRRSDDALRDMGGMVLLAGDLLRIDTPSAAMERVVQLCFRRVGKPVVGLLPDPSGTGWSVIAVRGLGSAKRTALQRCFQDTGVRGATAATRERLANDFVNITGHRHARTFEASGSLVIVPQLSEDEDAFVSTAIAFLGQTLERIGTVDWAHARNERLDLAIACTAHELKAPLAGARAALDHVNVSDEDPSGQELLRRSRDELESLADLVDPLLRWSAGGSSLHLDRTDLVEVVRDSVESCGAEVNEQVVTVESTPHAWVNADAPQLGRAITNVVRNAVAYAPGTTPVRVTVEETDDNAPVRVRDHGPGVAASERHLIFDPFARGMVSDGREGKGLGLFIARRIVEAHGGAIGLRSVVPGAEFWIELPSLLERRSASAS